MFWAKFTAKTLARLQPGKLQPYKTRYVSQTNGRIYSFAQGLCVTGAWARGGTVTVYAAGAHMQANVRYNNGKTAIYTLRHGPYVRAGAPIAVKQAAFVAHCFLLCALPKRITAKRLNNIGLHYLP